MIGGTVFHKHNFYFIFPTGDVELSLMGKSRGNSYLVYEKTFSMLKLTLHEISTAYTKLKC